MILFATNVLLDIATADPVWLPWSEKEFRAAASLNCAACLTPPAKKFTLEGHAGSRKF
jgi:hypothetical protein